MINNLKIQLLQRLIYFWDVLFTLIDLAQLKVYIRMKARLSELEVEKFSKKSQKSENFSDCTKINKNDIIILQENWDKIENKPKIRIKRGCGGLK